MKKVFKYCFFAWIQMLVCICFGVYLSIESIILNAFFIVILDVIDNKDKSEKPIN